jgi:rod shape-determining protein MreD
MFGFKQTTILRRLLINMPILLLLISVLNEFDFNYIEINFFSFNFPFILIFYWSLKKSEVLGYGYIFIAGLINDVVVGFPLGISSLCYLLICGFASYLRNITLSPNLLKDWFFFLFTILVTNSLMYSLLVWFFSFELNYNKLLSNLLFTFLLYVLFAYLFNIYHKIVFGRIND